MIKLKLTKSIEIEIDKPRPDLIVDSLSTIGFKDIQIKGNLIEFNSNIKDPNLESFQRRYGKGLISFKTLEKSIIITAITETKQNFRISLLLTLGFIILTIYFGLSSDRRFLDLLIFGGVLIISFFLEFLIQRSLISYKQTGLLDLLSEKIKIASP